MDNKKLLFYMFLFCVIVLNSPVQPEDVEVDCTTLRMGQYLCPDPNYDYIDPNTQTYRGCRPDNKAKGLNKTRLITCTYLFIYYNLQFDV